MTSPLCNFLLQVGTAAQFYRSARQILIELLPSAQLGEKNQVRCVSGVYVSWCWSLAVGDPSAWLADGSTLRGGSCTGFRSVRVRGPKLWSLRSSGAFLFVAPLFVWPTASRLLYVPICLVFNATAVRVQCCISCVTPCLVYRRDGVSLSVSAYGEWLPLIRYVFLGSRLLLATRLIVVACKFVPAKCYVMSRVAGCVYALYTSNHFLEVQCTLTDLKFSMCVSVSLPIFTFLLYLSFHSLHSCPSLQESKEKEKKSPRGRPQN